MSMERISHPRLSELTSLRLGGTALAMLVLRKPGDLDSLAGEIRSLGGRPCALGKGTNILATDGELDLVLVRMAVKDETGLRIQDEEMDGKRLVRVHGGTPLPLLLKRLASAGLTGLEGLSGIPGTMGGAVAMNAGSFGNVMGDVLHGVRIWTPEQGLRWYCRKELDLGYRHFSAAGVEGFHLVAEAELLLAPHEAGADAEQAMLAVMKGFLERKKASQPVTAWSAGCLFRNPEGHGPAGMLLDQAGFKGRRLGGMAFSDMHANFLINTGTGTSEQAFELISLAREAVERQHGVSLELEVKVWESR